MDTRPPDDELVRREEEAARDDVDEIAGTAEHTPQRPVSEGGGGEAEGFELAEHDLIDNAEHGDGGGDPAADAFTPEVEADRSSAVDGEADHAESSEAAESAPD